MKLKPTVSFLHHDSPTWWSLCNIKFSTSNEIIFGMGDWCWMEKEIPTN